MSHCLVRSAFPLALLAFALITGHTVFGQDPVQVTVQSGREFTGYVDSRSDDETLWLRSELGSTVIRRPIRWTRVVEVRTGDGQVLAPREALERAAGPSQLPEAPPIPAEPFRPLPDQPGSTAPTDAARARQALGLAAPVRSIDFRANLANWDADVAQDGLELSLYPQDGRGRLVAAGGVLQVTLIAPRSRSFDGVPHGRGLVNEQLGQWTRQVTPEDILAGKNWQLPFQAEHPEFDRQWGAGGLVHVRFTAPGHGVFHASQDAIRIRPFAPTRDWQILTDRDPFFHVEQARP